MKTINTSVLGFDVPVTEVPENLTEAITAAGGEQQLVDAFLNYTRFHKTNTEARAEVADRIEKLTGVPWKMRTVKAPTKSDPNNTREEADETESDYVKRAIAESGQSLADLAPQVLDGLSVKFNAQGSPRTGGPKRVAQVYTDAAQKIIESGKADGAIAKLQELLPGITIERGEDGKPVVESLAAAIKANKERAEREAMAAVVGV